MFGKAFPPAESAEGRRGRLNYSASVRTGGQVVGCGFAAPDNLWIAFGCGRRAALWGTTAWSPLGFRVSRPEAVHRVAAGDSLRRPKGRCFGFGGGSGALSATRNLLLDKGVAGFGEPWA